MSDQQNALTADEREWLEQYLEAPETTAAPLGAIRKLVGALTRIADAVTANREGTSAFHDGCEAIQRECLPLFAAIGLTNEGDGWGFVEQEVGA